MSLSSTAFTLQALGEKKELSTKHGRLAFSVLLFQDLAAIPILALVPLLAGGAALPPVPPMATAPLPAASISSPRRKRSASLPPSCSLGRPVLAFVYRTVARTGLHEAMTATALLTVIGVALLMEAAGLSAALGAFIAGALLADSEYRHEVEADIEPFKGLLLGLFFTAIGMSLNIGVALSSPLLVLGLVVGLVARQSGGALRDRAALPALQRQCPPARPRLLAGWRVRLRAADGRRRRRAPCERPCRTVAVVVTVSMVVTPFALLLDEFVLDRRPKTAPVYDADAGRGAPRHHRRLRPLRPDHRAHPAGQGHPVHRA